MTQPTPPGWYPDPSGAPGQRYFDGKDWTEHRAAAQPPAAPPSAPAPYGPVGARKRKVWPWVLLTVIVLFFGGCAALLVVASINSGTNSDRKTAAGMGQEVRDGKFAFTVTDVSTAKTAGSHTARGEFIVVTMNVKNTGDEPRSFFPSNQKLRDSAGREYAADTMAAMSLNTNDTMVIDLNPGFDITVKVPFDVPLGTQAAELEVHDSMLSGGARIKLS